MRVWLSSQTCIKSIEHMWKKTLRNYKAAINLEWHKHWTRLKMALKLGWVNDKLVLHKNIALFEQPWKGDEAAELKMDRMSIDSIYIEQAWNYIKHWTSISQ